MQNVKSRKSRDGPFSLSNNQFKGSLLFAKESAKLFEYSTLVILYANLCKLADYFSLWFTMGYNVLLIYLLVFFFKGLKLTLYLIYVLNSNSNSIHSFLLFNNIFNNDLGKNNIGVFHIFVYIF